MSENSVEIEGSVLDYTQTDIWQFFVQLRTEQQVRGYIPRSKEEIDADLAAWREEDEERSRGLEQIQEECWRTRSQSQTEAEG